MTELSTMVITEDCLPKFYSLANRYNLKTIVVIEDISEETRQKVKDAKYEVFSFNEVIEAGKSNRKELPSCHEDDIFTLCFTSGTTGMPKGCMLSHKMC